MCWGRSPLCSLEFLGTKLRDVRKDSWLTCPLVHITGRNLRRECPEGTLQGRLQHMMKALTQRSLCWEKAEGSPLWNWEDMGMIWGKGQGRYIRGARDYSQILIFSDIWVSWYLRGQTPVRGGEFRGKGRNLQWSAGWAAGKCQNLHCR